MNSNLSPYSPTTEQAIRISRLREAAWHFQDVMEEVCPVHIKLDRALLLLAEALHNANRAILESEDKHKKGDESGNARLVRNTSEGND